MHQETQQ